MLRTRLWMGALLIGLVSAVLWLDPAPAYPFLLLLVGLLAILSSIEMEHLIGAAYGVPAWQLLLSVLAVVVSSWPPRLMGRDPWLCVLATFAGVVLAAFLWEMARFAPVEPAGAEETAAAKAASGGKPGDVVVRLALVVWTTAYLGLLPTFLVQLRWAGSAEQADPIGPLLLAIFVPKCCDIGAYFTGRLLGRHRMAPVLSPKKTWEGLVGGLVLSMLTAAAINRSLDVLPGGDLAALGFGLSVGLAGTLGDLAESLIKRSCRQKDAGALVPGFGGVLDVIDAILFAAPVAYLWLHAM
jgi:phosphatidate cytidylyltransferase